MNRSMNTNPEHKTQTQNTEDNRKLSFEVLSNSISFEEDESLFFYRSNSDPIQNGVVVQSKPKPNPNRKKRKHRRKKLIHSESPFAKIRSPKQPLIPIRTALMDWNRTARTVTASRAVACVRWWQSRISRMWAARGSISGSCGRGASASAALIFYCQISAPWPPRKKKKNNYYWIKKEDWEELRRFCGIF